MRRRAERPAARRAAALVAALVSALGAAARPAAAQDPLARALDLERQGRLQDAAQAFRAVLARDVVSPAGLLGIERVFTQLGWRDSVLPAVENALRVDPGHGIARGIELRLARARGGEAQAAEVLRRWVEAAPRSDAPFREMVRLELAAGRTAGARAVIELARQRLADPEALQPELAQLETMSGDWLKAAAEWRRAVRKQPVLSGSASFSLQAAPVAVRDQLLRVLVEGGDSAQASRRVAAELLLGWNEPERAWSVLRAAVPRHRDEGAAVLRAFADRARAQPGAEAQRVAGLALEALATLLGGNEGAPIRVEAARAFAEAGDAAAARRMLRAMSEDRGSPAAAAASAAATLIELAVREGNAAEAERLLAEGRDRFPGGEVARLQLAVARAWLARGELDRAESAVLTDSSLAGDEVRGWVALYRGRLAAARELLRGAGPRASEGAAARERAATLALLQALEVDSVPGLGPALLLAARGDTAGAARALEAVARRGGLTKGEPDLVAWTVRYHLAAGDGAAAERLWTELVDRHPESVQAPSALLGLARAGAARGEAAAAIARLEALILNYPESAMVPEARRELNRIRGLVPRS